MRSLPVELLDIIVSELHPGDDSTTLRALALSCRALTAPSQKLLFSRIIISSPHRCCPSLPRFGGTAAAFKALLDHSPHVADLVRCLEIIDSPSWSGFWHECPKHRGGWSPGPNWLTKDGILGLYLPLLGHLRALIFTGTINFGQWNKMPHPFITAIRGVLQLPSLVYVDMDNTPILSLLMNRGSSVKHIVLHSTSSRNVFLEMPSDSPAASGKTLYIESLYFKGTSTASKENLDLLGIGNLESGISLRHLKRLHLHLSFETHSYPAFSKVLVECANSLEELIFSPCVGGKFIISSSLNTTDDFQGPREPLDLSKLKSLKRFHTFVQYSYSFVGADQNYDQMPWLLNFLSNCSTNHDALEEIVLEFDYYADILWRIERDEIITSWDEVGAVLFGERFPKLHILRILCNEPEAIEVVESSVLPDRVQTRNDFTFDLAEKRRQDLSRLALFVPNDSWLRQQ